MSWTNRTAFEIASAGPSEDFPAWLDVTAYVADDADQPGWRVSSGRIGALDTPQPARLDLALRNSAALAPIFAPVDDRFQRVVADGWGTADTGQPYTLVGAAGDFDVPLFASATITPTSTAADRLAVAAAGYDADVRVLFAFDALPAAGNVRAGAVARFADPDNHYSAQLRVDSTGAGEVRIRATVGGVLSDLATVDFGAAAAGVFYQLRLMCVREHLRVKVWPDSGAEPRAWLAMATDRHLTGGSHAGSNARDDSAAGGRIISFRSVTCSDPWAPAGRFTPANPESPVYPWWGQSRRIRCWEVYGSRRFDLFDGYVEWPTATVTIPDVDELVTVTAVDRLGRLANAPTFVSTLGAYIMHNGGSVLKAYWPLNDSDKPFTSVVGAPYAAMTSGRVLNFLTAPTAESGEAVCLPNSFGGPAGDDTSFAEYDVLIQVVGGFLRAGSSVITGAHITDGGLDLAAGQVLTVVAWVNSNWPVVDSESDPITIRYVDSTDTNVIVLVKQDGLNATWLLTVDPGAALSGDVAGPVAASDRWTLTALRFGYSPSVLELWVDDTVSVGSLSGSAPSFFNVTDVYMPYRSFAGSVAHVQVYIGAADDWNFDDFTAQRQAGLTGLERQHAGERVRTILAYAGVPAGVIDADRGSAAMSRAQLAGKTPLAALREAETTEAGRLFTKGERVTFHGRKRRYDI